MNERLRELKVRCPDRVRHDIVTAARQNGKSYNAEIVERLQSSLDGLLEEVLRETFGSDATCLIEVHRQGRLRLKPEDFEKMKAALDRFVERVFGEQP